jgi:hypothetical protein
MVARIVDVLLHNVDVTVTLTGPGDLDTVFTCSDINPTWYSIARAMSIKDPSLFFVSHNNVQETPEGLRFDVLLPTVDCVNVRARFSAVPRTPRFCCRVCRTTYTALLNARSCARSHATQVTAGATGPEPAVHGRRALMAIYWDGLALPDRRRVAAYALDDVRTVHGDLLGIHNVILKAVCGTMDGTGLVAALERVTEGTMLLPGFGTGAATNPNPHSVWDCEAVVAWWTAARLASEAMAHALLAEEAPHKEAPPKGTGKRATKGTKKPSKKRAKRPGAVEPAATAVEPAATAVEPAATAVEPAATAVEPVAAVEPCVEPAAACMTPALLPWSAVYVFEPVLPGEFDPTAAMLFFERRMQEVVMG